MRRRDFLANGSIVCALAVAGLGAGSLAGCAGPSASQRPAARAVREGLTFKLGSMEIIDATDGEPMDPVLAADLSETPAAAINGWAEDRVHVTGAEPGRLEVFIETASAARDRLEKTPGVRGWFTRDQEESVTVVFAARLEARRNDGSLIAEVTGRAEASRTFVEKVKPADRQAGVNALVRDALAAFEREIETRARAQMPGLLL